jgi:hypothetical protein
MANTTLKAIIDRFQAVCEASASSLKKTKDAFSHDAQPNGLLTGTYYLEDAGISSSVECSNNAEARIDQLTVWIARKVAFDGVTALETMETAINTLERAIVADGPAQGYHARLAGRKVSRPKDKDFLIGSATFTVDYDYTKTP